jgi:hypothetical protein
VATELCHRKQEIVSWDGWMDGGRGEEEWGKEIDKENESALPGSL